MNLVREITNSLHSSITTALRKARAEGKITYKTLPSFAIEVPKEKDHGDFAANVAMLLAKEAKIAPRKIAEILVEQLRGNNSQVEDIEVAGPGFINFYLKKQWLYQVPEIVKRMDGLYGSSDHGQGTKVQVEFVSANPTGLLHMGNARGAALGDSIANLLKMAGYEVSKEYYINDAGNQIENLGKSLEVIYLEQYGIELPFPEDGYHGDDLRDTVKRFIDKYADKYQDTSSELRKEKLIEFALAEKLSHIKSVLAQFGVEYDCWFSEQSLHDSGLIKSVIEKLEREGYTYEKDGAIWFKSREFGDEKDEVLVRSNGVPTYFAADIAYHQNKFSRGFDWIINIWGADHHGHINRMKGAVTALGYNPDQLQILIMQLVRLFRGGEMVRMSKRTGQYITLQELVEEVGKDPARYFFVMRSADSHLDFDLDLAKSSSQDNPVYYVQYAHARICSILRQAQEAGAAPTGAKDPDWCRLTEEVEYDLLRKIADFPEVIVGAALALEPHRLTKYADELANTFHGFYTKCRVINPDLELQQARLELVNCVRITLRNVLGIIGIVAPEKM